MVSLTPQWTSCEIPPSFTRTPSPEGGHLSLPNLTDDRSSDPSDWSPTPSPPPVARTRLLKGQRGGALPLYDHPLLPPPPTDLVSDDSEPAGCAITLDERLVKTNPIWFLPDLQRQGAVHLLNGKEEGAFIIRESSRSDTLALSVRLPQDKGPHVQHYIIERRLQGKYAVETSEKTFDSLPSLLVHYTACCDELPVNLKLPQCVHEARTRHELASFALLGQEFWGTSLASPSSIDESKTFALPHPKRPRDLSFSSFGKGGSLAKPSPNTPLTPLAALFDPRTPTLTPTRPAPPVPFNTTFATEGEFISIKQPQQPTTTIEKRPRGDPIDRKWSPPLPSPSNITVTTTLSFNVIGLDDPNARVSPPLGNVVPPFRVEVANVEIAPCRDSLRLHFRKSQSPEGSDEAGNCSSPPPVSKVRLRKPRPSSHYHESNIVDACYRSSLADKISDYEDLWTSPSKEESSAAAGASFFLRTKVDSEPPTPYDNAARVAFDGSHATDALPFDGAVMMQPQFSSFKPRSEISKSLGDLSESRSFRNLTTQEQEAPAKAASPFYVEPMDALSEFSSQNGPYPDRRKGRNRFSDSNLQWKARQMRSLSKIDSNENLCSSEENSVACDERKNPKYRRRSSRNSCRAKPVVPPRIDLKPCSKPEVTWRVDSSWEYLNCGEPDTRPENSFDRFPLLDACDSTTVPENQTILCLLRERIPHLCLSNGSSPEYDNVRGSFSSSSARELQLMNSLGRRSQASTVSDSGTEFSEPWDSKKWRTILDCGRSSIPDDSESLVQVTGESGAESNDDSEIKTSSPLMHKINSNIRSKIMSPELIAQRDRRDALGGSAIRSYAMDLGRDSSTTFSQAVENFITCTKESSEKDPFVVCRNVRQFMSGMKNFLVTSGEKDFLAIVKRERSALKSTEFLNLDAILEDVLVRLVLRPLWNHVSELFVDNLINDGSIHRLSENIQKARNLPCSALGFRNGIEPPSGEALRTIETLFSKMLRVFAPREKLAHLLAIVSIIYRLMNDNGGGMRERDCDADDLVPVLAWTVAHCGVIGAEIEAAYLECLLISSASCGHAGYYLHAFHSAVHTLKQLGHSSSSSLVSVHNNGSLGRKDCYNQSIQDGVLRIIVPDEHNGSLVTRTLPVRPGSTAKQVCKMLAHKLTVFNPQDYALYALVNGQETILADNDCPQKIKCEYESYSQHCLIAFKRIEAKIAWPIASD